jgi:hypothetical protein
MKSVNRHGLRLVLVIASAGLLVGACVTSWQPVEVAPLEREVTYLQDVKPILDKRCVVCHSCYNAACQLKLGSYEAIDRGGSKIPVYLGSRLNPQDPTRLFVDAHSTDAWRAKGFHSVTESAVQGEYNDSLMLHMLEQRREHPESRGSYHAEAANLTCAASSPELQRYLTKNPDNGMPFGFPPLEPDEHEVVATWLSRGATGPSKEEQARLKSPSPAARAEIEAWEAFLNEEGAKHAMTARYLYEHFFLAHLVFSEADATEFYRLVRSTSPPGEPISVIATVRPYDDPGVPRFWYRFEKIHSTIVYKTHMVVEFTDETLARYSELFIGTEWLEEPHLVGLDDRAGANPFVIYAQIPPRVRYEFLLDHSEYILRTFIRGPVCKGQVALNVIHDHFWVMFLDPDADLTVKDPGFLTAQADNLRLPNEEGGDAEILKSFSNAYRERYSKFYDAKSKLYEVEQPEGFGIDAIWKGRRPEDSPVLTVYRHFDSASVHKGVLGNLPRTAWVIDYSQFERIYYALVAGFDVFGNLSHQANVRRYMDYLRMEGELNFVAFLPRDERIPMIRSWHIGDGAFEEVSADDSLQTWGTQIPYETDEPKRELFERVVDRHVLESAGIAFDDINYSRSGSTVEMPVTFNSKEDILNGFRALTAPGTAFIEHNNGYGVNVLYVRFRDFEGEDHFISIVINRWHDNVNSMFGEKNFLDSSKDTMDFIDGGVGSYPNYFLVVDAEDAADFFDMMANFDASPEYVAKIRKFGINRSESDFWNAYDWFQRALDRADPLLAGRYDLNRYHPDAADER